MKFRYYVTDTLNGCVFGCSSDSDAVDYAMCDDYFVVDTEAGNWLTCDGPQEITERE